MNLATLSQQKKQIRNFIDSALQKHFDKGFVDFSKRCRIEADVEKWKTENAEIKRQATGESDNWYSIYFDDEFVCSFPTGYPPARVELLFLKNLSNLIRDEDVFLDEGEYEIRRVMAELDEKDKKEALEKSMANAPAEVKQVIGELNEH